jgi:hypothetical protein
MKYFILFCIFSISLSVLKSQPTVPISSWESFISYNNAKALALADNIVFAANDLSVSSFNFEDYSVGIYNKITGLSDMGISTIAYNEDYRTLIIAYLNGNIDLLKPGFSVLNRPSIKQNTIITGDKSVKHIFCDSNQVYFSTDFGLVNFDMDSEEFGFTTFTPNVRVRSSCRRTDKLFISTSSGIYSADISDNLLDFNMWSKAGIADGLTTDDYDCKSMALLAGNLYADVNDTIVKYDGFAWSNIQTRYLEDSTLRQSCYTGYSNVKMTINPYNNLLTVSTGSNFVFILSTNGDLLKVYYDPTLYGNINDALLDKNTILWITGKDGYYKTTPSGIDNIKIQGPNTNRISDMTVSSNGTLWCAGAVRTLLGPQFDRTGVYRYDNRVWKNYNEKNNNELLNVFDINSVVVHPKSKDAYFGSLMSGLIRITPTDSIQITDKNTPGTVLEYASGNPGVTRISGLAFDKNNNLWMANNITLRPIVVQKSDGSWKNFSFPYAEFSYMAIDRYDNKWFMRRDGQITVYDSGDDIDDESDDRFVTLSSSNSNLGGVVTSVTADREGAVWVGTNNGVTIYNCNVLESNCQGLRPVINPDNFNGRLLEAEIVRTIAVDGANRKWIGTDKGVFLIDPETYELIHFFDEENSPLFSNKIIKITVDGNSGMVYIATDLGLQGFRAEATTGKKFMQNAEVIAYPNPVRPEYDGFLAIKNLAEDVNVKITDVSGNLVFEQTSYGGQAVWNCHDYLGQPALSGVYLVFVVNSDGTQKLVTKFVLVR